MKHIEGLIRFIQASPTAFQAVANIEKMLADAGFVRLNECQPWRVQAGGQYYVTRNQSTLAAFRVPEADYAHIQLVASHADSPAFKLKPLPAREAQGYALLNVEKYGGVMMSTWFDRPLSIAGRLTVQTADGVAARRVSIDRDLALIPNLPIHFNRGMNDGVKLNPQVDMLPVLGMAGADYLKLVAEAARVNVEDIVGHDLFLVNRDAPRLWGADNEYIASPRLDDLECAYASAVAMINAKPSRHLDMLCVYDNEEIGDASRQGADSTFLTDILARVARATGLNEPEAALARSFMLSCDNAHAVHPNHPEQYDEQNRVRMNGGVVVKTSATQKYTGDGFTQAVFETICRRAGVPTQRFANRSDIPGGTTLGNISTTHIGMLGVDIGLAQLAMHSANETAGARDLDHMIDALRAFHETEIVVEDDGRVQIVNP